VRVTVKLEAQGQTLDSAIAVLLDKWRSLVDDATAELPTDAEILVQDLSSGSESTYTVYYTGRTRINNVD